MKRAIAALVIALALFAVPAADAETSTYWQVWTGDSWAPFGSPTADVTEANIGPKGERICKGELRRYVIRTSKKRGGQCVITTDYRYYCKKQGDKTVILDAETAPECGPAVPRSCTG